MTPMVLRLLGMRLMRAHEPWIRRLARSPQKIEETHGALGYIRGRAGEEEVVWQGEILPHHVILYVKYYRPTKI